MLGVWGKVGVMLVIRKVKVILDHGGQGVRDITADAWAVCQTDDPVWPNEMALVSIHMTEEEARGYG